MGGAKAAWMDHEANVAAAAGYLVHVGHLEHCEYHEITYGGGFGELDDDFYRNAMADRNRGENGPVPWAADITARKFTDALKQAYEEQYVADDCYACAKNAAD